MKRIEVDSITALEKALGSSCKKALFLIDFSFRAEEFQISPRHTEVRTRIDVFVEPLPDLNVRLNLVFFFPETDNITPFLLQALSETVRNLKKRWPDAEIYRGRIALETEEILPRMRLEQILEAERISRGEKSASFLKREFSQLFNDVDEETEEDLEIDVEKAERELKKIVGIVD